MRTLRSHLALSAVAAVALGFGVTIGAAVPAAAFGPPTTRPAVFVSTSGTDSPSCGTLTSPCATIVQGVSNAAPGERVIVGPGTYAGTVHVTKRVRLQGAGATIDATGDFQGIWVQGPDASGTSVSGFTVSNAIGEGILLTSVNRVTIAGNLVTGNDTGAHSNVYPPCADNGPVPGDCGEAIHLQGTTRSQIVGNTVEHNVGGILVTDESGTTSGNLIARNTVVDNTEDCGITMPSHVPGLSVNHNRIVKNYIADNGGAGVLMAAPAPGTAVTHNVVSRNVIVGNGEGGVQLHAHAPSQSIDNNVITQNWIGTNNTVGDSDSGDMQTTGIIVWSAVVPVNGLVIQHNVITDNEIGIWLSPSVSTSRIAHNLFVNVGTDIVQ